MIVRRSVSRVLSVRPMVREDLQGLRERSARTQLKNLADAHHNVARLLASGLSVKEVARRAGYSCQRITMLKADPSMKELVAHYRGIVTKEWADSVDEYYEDIYSAGRKSWRMLNQQLDQSDEEGDPLPINRLLAIAEASADRVGYIKRSATLNVNVDFAAKLEAAIARTKVAA